MSLKRRVFSYDGWMQTIMTLNQLTTIDQLECFLDGSQVCAYEVKSDKRSRYQWIKSILLQFRYSTLGKHDKGVIIRFLMTISGYSRQQITRLVKQYLVKGTLVRKPQIRYGFRRIYNDNDIRLLAEIDQLHETPCGTVIKKLCERAWQQGDARYERLSGISVSHIYNFRRSFVYRQKRKHFTKTKSKPSSIGERRKPNPKGQPGYLRVDTVHQGDQDKKKGVYHINLVDEFTQFEIAFAVEKISERYLLPGLEAAMMKIPFKIRGFHSDNGSEFINKNVAGLLGKLCIEFTKSRSRQSNDNALVESKNASVIRKHFGYSHIPQCWAGEINSQIQEPLYRYQNFHRPCFYPTITVDKKGKERKRYDYKNLMTPFEKLKSIDQFEDYLNDGVTVAELDDYAKHCTDTEAAEQLKLAKQDLFESIIKASA